jgi:transcription initiation factor TFIID subunit 2
MHTYADAWLTKGISNFLGAQYVKKAFGNNEYRMWIHGLLNEVVEYEQKYGGFPLDPTAHKNSQSDFYFSTKSLQTMSPLYLDAYVKKSTLVIRMMEDRIGKELMLQVFNKLLTLATISSQQKVTPSTANAWNNMLLSASSYSKAIFTVTGKDISAFVEQWVNKGGHAKFTATFVFNRKRNTVELEIKQLDTGSLGVRRYMGPLMVWIQELDGSFKHNLQIEENTTKHDITCHSKSRRNKKKKIPLCTGEEVDMDLSQMDADSPVLWIRVDPDMQMLRQIVIEQPDYQWQYQLRYEKDVTAQIQAISHLEKYATQCTRKALTDVIENDQCFYRIRCEATMCLRSVANQMAANWTGPPPMVNNFKKLFGSYSCPHIIKLNNFSKIQLYFLQKAMPVAMAGLRTSHGICPHEVVRFLLDLFKYNDNSKNKFSDNYYRASLITALAETVTPAVTAVLARQTVSQASSAEALSSETKLILEEITRYFNLEKLIPCYKHTVTVSCLKAIRKLQKMGHLPSNPAFFKEYAQYGVFSEVRAAAIDVLIDVTKAEQRKEDLDFLLDLVELDPVFSIRHETLRNLTLNPPFTKKDTTPSPLNTPDLVDRIWKMMNQTVSFDQQLRCSLVDFYFALYGRVRPSCLPKPELSVVLNLKEKTAISSFSEDVDDDLISMDRRSEDSSNKRPLPTDFVSPNQKVFKSSDHDVFRSFSPKDEDTSNPKADDFDGATNNVNQEPVASASGMSAEELKKLEKKKNKEEKDRSKPHKDKKKKKKKHKKHKHKRDHKDQERHRSDKNDGDHHQQPQASTSSSHHIDDPDREEGEISGSEDSI